MDRRIHDMNTNASNRSLIANLLIGLGALAALGAAFALLGVVLLGPAVGAITGQVWLGMVAMAAYVLVPAALSVLLVRAGRRLLHQR